MSSNAVTNGIILGAAGAGVGYAVGSCKTSELSEKLKQIEEQKKPIADKFEKYGYKEGMNIQETAQKKVNEAYLKMRENGLSVKQSNSAKILGRIYDKNVKYLTDMQTTYNTAVKKCNQAIQNLTTEIKNVKNRNMKIGAAVGVGLVVLNQIRKALFSKQ